MALIALDDPADPRLDRFLGLRNQEGRQQREQPGGDMARWFMAEGWLVIQRAIAAGMRLDSVLVDSTRIDHMPELPAEVDVISAGPQVLADVGGRPTLRDPIGCFTRPPPTSVEELLEPSSTLAVLEGIVNPTNMGVIMRCAAGLGIDAVLVDPTSCDPLYRRAVRVSMGECFAIPHARLDPIPGGLEVLRKAGFALVALTPTSDAVDIDDLSQHRPARLAIMLGSEGPGLSPAALATADHLVRIPMSAGVDSINVGSASAVAFHRLSLGQR